MVQILTVKYTKEEERAVVASNILGILVGIPIGLLLGYLTGFFPDMESAAASSIGWAIFIFKIGSIGLPLSWAATTAICFLLWNKKRVTLSKAEIKRIIPGTFFLPLGLTFGLLVMALIVFPLCFLVLDYINRPITGMIIGALALLPLMIVIGGILLPDTIAGKALRRFVHRSKRSNKKASREEVM
jgi:MFS family permease